MIDTALRSLALSGYRSYNNDLEQNTIDFASLSNAEVERRFIPYIQLHEFEALLFTNIRILKKAYLNHEDQKSIDLLYEQTKNIPPEDINHGPETAPSKRLLNAIDYKKGERLSKWLDIITIEAILQKCPHFSEWLDKLQALAAEQ